MNLLGLYDAASMPLCLNFTKLNLLGVHGAMIKKQEKGAHELQAKFLFHHVKIQLFLVLY